MAPPHLSARTDLLIQVSACFLPHLYLPEMLMIASDFCKTCTKVLESGNTSSYCPSRKSTRPICTYALTSREDKCSEPSCGQATTTTAYCDDHSSGFCKTCNKVLEHGNTSQFCLTRKSNAAVRSHTLIGFQDKCIDARCELPTTTTGYCDEHAKCADDDCNGRHRDGSLCPKCVDFMLASRP